MGQRQTDYDSRREHDYKHDAWETKYKEEGIKIK